MPARAGTALFPEQRMLFRIFLKWLSLPIVYTVSIIRSICRNISYKIDHKIKTSHDTFEEALLPLQNTMVEYLNKIIYWTLIFKKILPKYIFLKLKYS